MVRPVAEFPPLAAPPVPEWGPGATPRPLPVEPGRVVTLRKPIDDAVPKVDAPPVPVPADPPEKDPKAPKTDGDAYPYVGVPERNLIFKIETPGELEKRIIRELVAAQKQPGKPAPDPKGYQFPPLPVLSPPGVAYTPKTSAYPPVAKQIEPNYVVHRRLYFEEKNTERFGWDAGALQPAISTLYFYRDVLLWPSRLGSNLCERFDASAGKCLPGSPVPYYLYPRDIDLWGGLIGAGVYTGVAVVLP